MKKILITGASGLIGHYTTQKLVKNGYQVHIISRKPTTAKNVVWHCGDLFNSIQLRETIQKIAPTYLLHFAWEVSPTTYLNSLDNYKWVLASMDLLQLFHKNGGQRAVFAGTCAEYDWGYGHLHEENTPLKYDKPYKACKNSLNHLASSYSNTVKMSFAWGRIFWLFGPRENNLRLIPSLITSLLNGKEFLCRNGDAVRDFLYVSDVADAFAHLLLNNDVEGSINIASGVPLKIKDLLSIFAEQLNKKDLVKFERNKEDYPFIIGNISRLKDELNWTPKIELEMGVRTTLNYWIKKRGENTDY